MFEVVGLKVGEEVGKELIGATVGVKEAGLEVGDEEGFELNGAFVGVTEDGLEVGEEDGLLGFLSRE